ncbi:MAG: hypothetical protein M0027_17620 [Candidatus Dormibacteraeota bacterium]|nr:hypothetical protein [Candidatus Dormibacteraeota bacterium]
MSSHHPGYRKHRSLSFEGGMRVLVHEATPRGAAEAYFDTLEAALEEILAWQRDPTKFAQYPEGDPEERAASAARAMGVIVTRESDDGETMVFTVEPISVVDERKRSKERREDQMDRTRRVIEVYRRAQSMGALAEPGD